MIFHITTGHSHANFIKKIKEFLNMKISVSLLSSYLYCSRKVFLERVLKLAEPPKESLVFGSIRHETYDSINKNEEAIVKSITKMLPLADIQLLYKKNYLKFLRKTVASSKKRLDKLNINMLDAYKRAYPYIMEESLIRANNIHTFIEKNNIFGDILWEKLTPKIISELRIDSDELRLRGIIDQIYVYGSEYVPYELKTGKMPKDGVWPSHRIQLAAYSLLLEEKFNSKIKEGFVFYLDSRQKRHIAFNPFMKEEVANLVDEVISVIQGKEVPDFCENKNKCINCGLRETCYSKDKMNELLNVNLV
jgi:CRISPR-associated protein Cas4